MQQNTVRMLLSVAANLDWPPSQLDFNNAFLNENLEEELYMNYPPGSTEKFGKQGLQGKKKNLYGLKRSPEAGPRDPQYLFIAGDTAKTIWPYSFQKEDY